MASKRTDRDPATPEPSVPDAEDSRRGIRDVLDEIGAKEELAQVEARVAGVEQDLERAGVRSAEADRARKGELDVMRARLTDALNVVEESVTEHRDAWSQLESRLTQLSADGDAAAASSVASLREELTPLVHRATVRTDEVAAELTGKLDALATDVVGTSTRAAAATQELRALVERTLAQVRERQAAALVEQQTAADAVAETLRGQVHVVREDASSARGALDGRIDALRRELDGSAGELRASMNLRAQELGEQTTARADELAAAIDEQGDAFGEFERRWIEGTRDLAKRIEDANAQGRERAARERDERVRADQELQARIDAAETRTEELDGRQATESTRRTAETEQLRRGLEETSGKVDVLSGRVTAAVEQVSEQLQNRVAGIGAELQAVREASVRQSQKLAAVDTVAARVAELAATQESLRSDVATGVQAQQQGLTESIAELRRDLAAVTDVVKQQRDQQVTLIAGVEKLAGAVRAQAAVQQELRDLTARTSELTTRITETEKLARAAGQAIAAAVRKARQNAERTRGAVSPLPPPPDGVPSVAAAERAPLFQDRERITADRPDPLASVSGEDADVADAVREVLGTTDV